MQSQGEFYISVDVETAGPVPSQYALLSIGACTLEQPRRTFYAELKPDKAPMTAEAQAIHGLDLNHLAESGRPAEEAMHSFAAWLKQVTPPGMQPVCVAFNAPFDWMFIEDYFYRYYGYNPFGYSALDIKALYMGMAGVTWRETSKRYLSPRYLDGRDLTHNALEDALEQAEIFEKILREISARQNGLNSPPDQSNERV